MVLGLLALTKKLSGFERDKSMDHKVDDTTFAREFGMSQFCTISIPSLKAVIAANDVCKAMYTTHSPPILEDCLNCSRTRPESAEFLRCLEKCKKLARIILKHYPDGS
jgi:hypothetical protein